MTKCKLEEAISQGSGGTALFLSFHPSCRIHQMLCIETMRATGGFITKLEDVVLSVFVEIFDKGLVPFTTGMFNVILDTRRDTANNSDVCIVFEGIHFKENWAIKLLLSLKHKLEKTPIGIFVNGEVQIAHFNGCGFRYI